MGKKYGLLLDLDGTLYDYETTHSLALQKTYQSIQNIAKQLSTYNEFHNLYLQAKQLVKKHIPDSASSHNRIIQFQTMLELIQLPVIPTSKKMYETYWEYFLETMKPYNDVNIFLKNIQSQATTCIVTNLTTYIQHKKIEKLGIAPFIDYVVTSEEVGLEKPHPIVFYHALQKINKPAQYTYMIGDSVNDDIYGALKLGIKPLLFSEDSNQPYITFNSYNNVPIDFL